MAFCGFSAFAAGMMLFYKSEQKDVESSKSKQIIYGVSVGAFAGFLGGLLGVGGGNFIVPVLVWLGYNPKKASATTSFIVIFSSFSGFLGHATVGNISAPLLGFTAVGSALRSWGMVDDRQTQTGTCKNYYWNCTAGDCCQNDMEPFDLKDVTTMAMYRTAVWMIGLLILSLFQISILWAAQAKAATVEAVYPGLATGVLKSARLVNLDNGVLLESGTVQIDESLLKKTFDNADPKLREQFK